MSGLIAVAIIVLVIGAVILGAVAGGQSNVSIKLGTNVPGEDCTALCNQWDARRQEKCAVQAAVDAAQRRVDNFLKELAASLAVATAFGAAAAVALTIPPFGWIVAIGMAAVAAAALLASTFIAGEVAGARGVLDSAERDASNARVNETEARRLLTDGCPDANECLGRQSPC